MGREFKLNKAIDEARSRYEDAKEAIDFEAKSKLAWMEKLGRSEDIISATKKKLQRWTNAQHRALQDSQMRAETMLREDLNNRLELTFGEDRMELRNKHLDEIGNTIQAMSAATGKKVVGDEWLS